jgi:hypothetical protein
MRVSSRLFFRTACCSLFRIEKYDSVISGYILRAGDYKPRLGYKSIIVILSFFGTRQVRSKSLKAGASWVPCSHAMKVSLSREYWQS